MEIKIKSSYIKKSIEANKSIISIQSDNDIVIDNLIKDYKPVVIENDNLFFLGETVLEEISLFNNYPELNIVNDIMQILDLNSSF